MERMTEAVATIEVSIEKNLISKQRVTLLTGTVKSESTRRQE